MAYVLMHLCPRVHASGSMPLRLYAYASMSPMPAYYAHILTSFVFSRLINLEFLKAFFRVCMVLTVTIELKILLGKKKNNKYWTEDYCEFT